MIPLVLDGGDWSVKVVEEGIRYPCHCLVTTTVVARGVVIDVAGVGLRASTAF